MGYIELSDGLPNFAQAVISFWFRVPAATMTAGLAAYEEWQPENPGDLAQGVIPLITFGHRGAIAEGGFAGQMAPSVIGLSTKQLWEENTTNPVLYARFQYSTGGNPDEESVHNSPDFFQVGDVLNPRLSVTGTEPPGHIEVTPDVWHHVVLSFDFSGGCSVDFGSESYQTCPFYWAFDGVNYNGVYLWPYTPASYSSSANDNGIYSNWSQGGSFAAGALETSGSAIGIPGAGSDSDYIYNVIMAEIQIYTGVTMNTGANLDKFIADGHPVSQSEAAAFLGKQPEIYFRTQSDWITGNNRGTAGDFTPTGTIAAYTPGP